MAKITQKQLIESIKQLKQIKPNQEWASLLRSQIVLEKKQAVGQPARFAGFMNVFMQRKMVYSFAAMLLLIAGAFGLAKFLPNMNVSHPQTASITVQTGLKQNVVALNTKINDLAAAAKNQKTANTSAIKDISAKAKVLVQNLKNNPVQDTSTLKDIAVSLKTLADVSGTDLTANPDVQDLTQTIVQSEIADLQKTTLTPDQKTILKNAEELYKNNKFSEALEVVLSINK